MVWTNLIASSGRLLRGSPLLGGRSGGAYLKLSLLDQILEGNLQMRNLREDKRK